MKLYILDNDVHGDNLTLLEKLAKFSMSYSGVNCLSDFDPLTGSLNNRNNSALHVDSQTTMCSTVTGNYGINCSSTARTS